MEVDVLIGDIEGRKTIRVKALVDTGATFTIMPRNVARKLDLRLTGETVRVSTAKGYDELDLTPCFN